MERACVPEAPVDENGNTPSFPADIDTEPLVCKWPEVNAVSDAVRVQDPANGDFTTGVASLLSLHVPAYNVG